MVRNCKIYYAKKENKTCFVPYMLKEAIKEKFFLICSVANETICEIFKISEK